MQMRTTIALAVLVAACSGGAKPAPPVVGTKPAVAIDAAPPDATIDAALAGPGGEGPPGVGSGSGSGSGTAPPVYRTAASTYHADPAVAGMAKTYMVVSEAVDASKVGRDILARGGNAVDAAVATTFALAVVHPSAGSLGGGGFAVIRTGPGRSAALDFRETAPGAATKDMYVDKAGKPTGQSLVGPLASGVPGVVAGMFAMHQKYGKLRWADDVAPAIALAKDGFVLDDVQAGWLPLLRKNLARFPETYATWYPNGAPIAAGTRVTLPVLAATLERIAAKGADGFYKGETAAAIATAMQQGGGIITAADLAGYRAEWRTPIVAHYRGYALAAMPPPSSGGVVLALTANILGKVAIDRMPWHGVDHLRWMIETWRRAYAARNELLGDPKYVQNPVARLTSQAYADRLRASIGDRATPSAQVPQIVEGNHTTNLCVVDARGMAVALTTTINTAFGSGVTVAGFVLNNEMDDFTTSAGGNAFGLVQGAANAIAPGKRMLSSMSPTIVEDARGNLAMVIGAGRGGPRIITSMWQTLSNLIDFKLGVADAVAAPRIHFQHLPDVVRLEAEVIDEPTAAALVERGYPLAWGWSSREFSAANAIVKVAGGWSGAADPRGGGAAIGD